MHSNDDSNQSVPKAARRVQPYKSKNSVASIATSSIDVVQRWMRACHMSMRAITTCDARDFVSDAIYQGGVSSALDGEDAQA